MEWSQKYAPRLAKDYLGIKTNVRMMSDFLDRWLEKQPLKKGFILYGVPGNGKTSILFALEDEYNLNIIEINASDKRNAPDLKKLIHQTGIKAFNDKQTVMLLDEADGVNSQSTLLELIECSRCPIVLTCNDIDKISYEVARECMTLEICYPPIDHIIKRLETILDAEDEAGRVIDRNALTKNKLREIASKCESVRSAILTLEMATISGDYDNIIIHDVDKSENQQISLLFSGQQVNITLDPATIKKWAIKNGVPIHALDKLISMSKIYPNFSKIVKEYSLTLRGIVDKLQSPYSTNFKRTKRAKKEPKKVFKPKEDKPRKIKKKIISDNKTFDNNELW